MTKEQFIKDYSFQPGDYKWLVGGGNILKYIGTEVIFATYETLENDEIKENYQEAHIHEISGYEPVTMTYLIKYTVGKDPKVKEDRIIPEGFIMIDEKDKGKPKIMHKFIPYSHHMNMIETASYYNLVGKYFDENRKVIPFKGLKILAENKDQSNLLGYSVNLVAAIRPVKEENGETYNDESQLYIFRISKLGLKHKFGHEWILSLTDQEKNTYTILINDEDEYYEFFLKDRVGDLKIIDLGGSSN